MVLHNQAVAAVQPLSYWFHFSLLLLCLWERFYYYYYLGHITRSLKSILRA